MTNPFLSKIRTASLTVGLVTLNSLAKWLMLHRCGLWWAMNIKICIWIGLRPTNLAFSHNNILNTSETRSRPATILLEISLCCCSGLNVPSFIKNACRGCPTGKVSNPNQIRCNFPFPEWHSPSFQWSR